MAINSIGIGTGTYNNTLGDGKERELTKEYHSNADIFVDRGGVAYIRNQEGEDDNAIPNNLAVREILPEHSDLRLRDIRFNFRKLDNKEYVSIYNRHTNELLKHMPRQDFTRLFGKITENRNNTFELYV